MPSHHFAIIVCFVFTQILSARAAELGKNPLGGAELDDEDISEGSGLDGSCSVDTCPGICCPSTVATILEPTTKPPRETPKVHVDPSSPPVSPPFHKKIMGRAEFTTEQFLVIAACGTFLLLVDKRLLM